MLTTMFIKVKANVVTFKTTNKFIFTMPNTKSQNSWLRIRYRLILQKFFKTDLSVWLFPSGSNFFKKLCFLTFTRHYCSLVW